MAAGAQAILDAINDALLAWAQNGIEKTVTVYGRTYTIHEIDQVRKLRADLMAELAEPSSTQFAFPMYGAQFSRPKAG